MDNQTDTGMVVDGKYRIGRVIGSGGMGVVYAATDFKTQETVALKLLHSRYSNSSKIVKRFYQEAALEDSLRHPNICRAIDHGCTKEGAPYLVMPLLKGCSFAKLLSDNKFLPVPRAIHIVAQTLSALEFAHSNRIVHRDLKPDNIFVLCTNDDPPDTVKLLDFGISKVLEKETASTLTSTGMVLGTAYYLAPEQARGERKIDHRVDIYAMGVILYQALAGQLPFVGESYNEVVYKIVGAPYKLPRAINPDISRSLERVILTAMSIDPLQRYETAREMSDALLRAIEKPEIEAVDATAELLADTEKMSVVDPLPVKPLFTRKGRGIFVGIGLVAASALGIVMWNGLKKIDRESPATLSTHGSTSEQKSVKDAPFVLSSRNTADSSLPQNHLTLVKDIRGIHFSLVTTRYCGTQVIAQPLVS